MTPWSESNKKQRLCYGLVVGFFVLCLLYSKVAEMNGGIKVMFACFRYFVVLVQSGDLTALDYKAASLGILTLMFVLTNIGLGLIALFYEPPEPYGEARFSTNGDLKKMRLKDKANASGIIVGKVGKTLLSPPNLRHGIALAPTRSGKTAGFVIPSALSFKGSLIITDPKGELENLLAEPLRRAGKTVYSIDWSDENSKHAWNPLSLKVYPSVMTDYSKAERQAERIAAMLVGQRGETSDHWEMNAKKHIAALILLSVYLAELSIKRLNPSLPETIEDYNTYHEPHLSKVFHFVAKDIDIKRFLSAPDTALKSAKDNLRDLLTFCAEIGAPKRIINDLSTWYNAPDNEAGSHMTTFLSKVQLWRSAAVKGATRNCSFEWQDLRDTPSVVFIKFPQQDAQSLGILTALFFETFFGWALDTAKKPNEAPIAILADEFGSLPRINLMTDFLSKGAGMGAVIWIIVQDFAQIKSVYGDKRFDTIKTNCSYLLTYAQNNFNTQKELAQMTGKAMHKKRGKSKNAKGETGTSESAEGLDLIPISDWGTIPFGHHILLVQGFMTRPVYCKTPLYFKEKYFRKKLHG